MSSIFEVSLSTSEVQEAFSPRSFLQAMLLFEAALARAQAQAGLIPATVAQSIIGTCKVELFDVAKIVRDSEKAGSMAAPFIKNLKETVGLFNQEAAGHVQFGASDQDLLGTALALVTRDALALIRADVHQAVAALLALAGRHAGDPLLARGLMQPAPGTTFGLMCTGWAAPLLRSLQRLALASANALSLQLGGVAGTLAGLQVRGAQVAAQMASELQLNAPLPGGDSQRDEWVALGCELGLLTGSLGNIAHGLWLMGQHEVGEVSMAAASNGRPPEPLPCMVALAASARAPQRVAALLAAMPQALGQWQAGLAEWPGLVASAHGSARAVAHALAGLQVHVPRMRANLQAWHAQLPAPLADEAAGAALAGQAAELTRAQVARLAALHGELLQKTPSLVR